MIPDIIKAAECTNTAGIDYFIIYTLSFSKQFKYLGTVRALQTAARKPIQPKYLAANAMGIIFVPAKVIERNRDGILRKCYTIVRNAP
jgi:hypothetical protein